MFADKCQHNATNYRFCENRRQIKWARIMKKNQAANQTAENGESRKAHTRTIGAYYVWKREWKGNYQQRNRHRSQVGLHHNKLADF
ncbi:hypothetical protein PR048_013150 [Dryococelus australis]|uniref:Uncharacterized protein n=1 Tax=Dryococelus australis TaxID=614101 RepID=A0ABQ9HRC9_9NEOP|nr:hypothetical protein PR048_013150 [Dryococelus australis]